MKNIVKYFFITISIILLASCQVGERNMKKNNYDQMLHVKNSELTIVHDEHPLLNKTKDIVKDPGKFSFSQSFQPNQNLVREYKLDDQSSFKFLKVRKDEKFIQSKYLVDNGRSYDMKITLLCIQRNENTKIRLSNNDQWFSALTFVAKSNSTTTIQLDISWDPKGVEELIIFPIKDEYVQEKGHSLIRTPVISEEENINDDLIDKLSIKLDRKNISVIPILKTV
jgi:hypothetical protein